MDDDEEDTDVEVLTGDEIVEVTGAEVEAELRLDPITAPHDTEEWLQGFNAGVKAGRKDVLQVLYRVLGDGPLADDISQKIKVELGDGT